MLLAVWVDARTSIHVLPENLTGGAVFNNNNGSLNDVYAARLDAQGNLIDTTPIIVGQATLNQALPDVAWNGQNWLVVWSGEQGIACCGDINVYAARISPEGVVLDEPPISVDRDDSNSGLYWPTVESDGTNWLVVWRDLDQNAGIFTLDGARIAPDGTILDPGGRRLRRDTHNSYPVDPDLAFAGDRYLLTWTEDSGEVKGQLLTTDLLTIGPAFQINLYSPTVGYNPRVATNGVDFLVAYWEDRYYAWTQLRAVRVSHTGQVLDPDGLELTEAYGYTNYDPSIAWNGSTYVVVFDGDAFIPDIYFCRVTPQGGVLDYNGLPVLIEPSVQNQSAVAAMPGGSVLALWKDTRHGSDHIGDIYGAVISSDAQIGASYPISLGTPRQTRCDLVDYPDGYLAVYRSETAVGVRILAQRINPAGFALDPEPIAVASGTHEITNPAVAWNGDLFLVVWEDGESVFGRRLDESGVPIDPSPISIVPGEMPEVEALGDLFLVVSSHEYPHEHRPIKGARVRASDGVVLDGSPILIGSSFSEWPNVAALGNRWIAVWEQYPSHDNPRSNIYANFIDAAGVTSGSFAVHTDQISPSRSASITVAGATALIVWEDERTQPEFQDIYGRRIQSSGGFLDPGSGIPLSTAANEQYEPQVAWDGNRFVLLHGDSREDDPYEQHRGDLCGLLLSGSAQPLDEGFPVFCDTIPEVHPAVEARAGTAIYAGSVFRQEQPYVAYRIGIRVLDAPVSAASEGPSPRGLSVIVAPNPNAGPLTIKLEIPSQTQVIAGVYDAMGRELQTLAAGSLPAGTHALAWNGRDATGRVVPAGVYFVRVHAGAEQQIVKVTRR